MKIKNTILFLFAISTFLSFEKIVALTSQECQNRFEALQTTTPNLNEYVFHSRCGTKHMMEIQKASEVKYGSNTTFLERVLLTAKERGIYSGQAVDLGSGTGVWTKHLLTLGTWDVHAIDLYKPSLDDLKATVSSDAKGRLTLHNADFRTVTFPEMVDLVVANNSLCFVPRSDLKAVLDNIYDNLTPGGIFAATFWGDHDVRGDDPELSTFTPEEVKKLFDDKYTIISCCNSEEGMSPNLDGDVVTWNVIYAIVQKPK
jgi:tellurite methyltransferase